MKRILLPALLFIAMSVRSQNTLTVVPMPADIKMGKGNLIIREPIGFIVNDGIEPGDGGVALFKQFLKKNYGFTKFKDGDTHSYGLPTEIFLDFNKDPKDEGYKIEITNKEVLISGDAKGIFQAFETLKQLIGKNVAKQVSLPVCTIKDSPRFAYRGMHLDVSRHFMPLETVKKYIGYLATYKFNTFHWHLTDDQGWRIEIKKYPKLTEIGGWRNGTIVGRYPGKGNDSIRHGGFYTQQQIKEIIKYAADRYITVIPEIEMPGHASAAIAAYPQLSCFPDEDTKHPADCAWAGTTSGKQVQQTWGVFEDVFCPSDYTFNFLQDVLDEVMALFPSQYIHIGGDECPKEAWKRSEFCQQLMRANNLKDEHALQSYFIQRIEKYINSKGRKIIGWDEILEGGLAPNAAVMSWRGEEGGIEAAKQDHDVIMTPGTYCYIDHAQSKNEDSVTIGGYLPVEQVYSYDPVPAALNAQQSNHILGAQANVWTEYIGNQSKLEYMIFPRMAAMAEVLWTPKAKKSWKDFERRLPALFEKLNQQKVNYSKAYYEPTVSLLPSNTNQNIIIKVKTKQPKASFYFGNKTNSIFSIYTDSIVSSIKESGVYGIRMLGKLNPELKAEKWGLASLSPFEYLFKTDFKINFNKATGKKTTLTTPPSKQYPGDGAFTLVNGVQNEKGMARSSEFIGFNGTDCEAIIDLGKAQDINNVVVHTLHQKGSWIWRPVTVEAFASADGINFTTLGLTDDFERKENGTGTMTIHFDSSHARYVKVLVKNWSPIPDKEPGAGNNSWLFVDEIEVE